MYISKLFCLNNVILFMFVLTLAISSKTQKTFRWHYSYQRPTVTTHPCSNVCKDLPPDDKEPVCMIFSRYKRGYQFFVNLCHARQTICRENIVMHIVHPSRCMKTKQLYMPIN